MQNGDVALIKTNRDEVPEGSREGDWITNSRYVLVRENSIDGILTGKVFVAPTGARFFKFEQADPTIFGSDQIPLVPGVFVEVSAGATMRDDRSKSFKPGLHDLSAISRICYKKDLRAANEQLWKSRARLLVLLGDFYGRIEVGIYEITEPPKDRHQPARYIKLSDQQAHELNQFMHERFVNADRTSPMNLRGVTAAIARIYRASGRAAPPVVMVNSAVVASIAASIAIALFEWDKYGSRAITSSATAGLLNDALWKPAAEKTERPQRTYPDNQLISRWEPDRRRNLAQGLNMLLPPSKHDWQPQMSQQLAIEIENAVYSVTKDIVADQVLNFQPAKSDSASDTDLASLSIEPVFGIFNYELLERLGTSCAAKLSEGNQSLYELMLGFLKRTGRLAGGVHGYYDRNDDEVHWLAEKGLSEKPAPINSDWETILSECDSYWFYDRFCIVSQHPEVIELDEWGRLHCENGPAIVWRDGLTQYYLAGMSVTKQIVESPESFSIAQMVDEPNVEIRRVMIQRYGEGKFLVDCGAELIQEDQCGALFRKELRDDEPLQMVRVKNSTPEPDGTYKNYFLRVPPNITTAREAVAWTFGMTAEEYEPSQES